MTCVSVVCFAGGEWYVGVHGTQGRRNEGGSTCVKKPVMPCVALKVDSSCMVVLRAAPDPLSAICKGRGTGGGKAGKT